MTKPFVDAGELRVLGHDEIELKCPACAVEGVKEALVLEDDVDFKSRIALLLISLTRTLVYFSVLNRQKRIKVISQLAAVLQFAELLRGPLVALGSDTSFYTRRILPCQFVFVASMMLYHLAVNAWNVYKTVGVVLVYPPLADEVEARLVPWHMPEWARMSRPISPTFE